MLGRIKALGRLAMIKYSIPTAEPLITVKEARKLLGSDCKYMDDTQVQEIISTLRLLARDQLHNYGSKNAYGV